MMRSAVVLLLLVLSALPAVGQSTLTAELQSLLEEAEIAGMSVATVREGRVAFLQGLGVRSSATNPPVDTSTVFEAASLTKPVVTLALLQLVDEGLVNLDQPLSEYGEYPDLAHTSRGQSVTARMILSHTSGLPNWRPTGGPLNFSGAPGQGFSYSGEGYVFLQWVIEKVTDRPLSAVVQDRVLVPLGMAHSSLIWEDAFGSVIAVGHGTDGTPLNKFTPTSANAAYSLHTTAGDYARFLAHVLAGGGLSAATFAEMISPQADAGDGLSWGLGWGIEQTAKGTAIWHWGDNQGYKSFVAGYPGQGRGFVVLTNSNNGMLALHRLVEVLDETLHPAVPWLAYERFDTPSFQVGRDLARALANPGHAPLRQLYQELKGRYPAEAFVEETLNDAGYRLLRQGRTVDAAALFELNVSQYPKSANAYDSLAEAYMMAGQLEKALLNYRVSVDMDPQNMQGRAMIVRLEADLKARGQ